MNKFSTFALVLIVSLGYTAGCTDMGVKPTEEIILDVPDEFVEVPNYPIDSKIVLLINEEITREGKLHSLWFVTERIYGRAGYKIANRIEKEDSISIIYLDSIKTPEASATILSPATAFIELGTLADGSYILELHINGKTLYSLVTLDESTIETKIQPNNYVSVRTPMLHRVPSDIIWGQAESFNENDYSLFLDSLMILGASTAVLEAGEYKYFKINPDGSYHLNSLLGRPYGTHFLYRFKGDTVITRNLVKRFAKRYGNNLYAILFGGRGEAYATTVLKWEP